MANMAKHSGKAPRKNPAVRAKEEFVFATGPSSLGVILVALSEFGIVSILRGNDPEQLAVRLQNRFRKTSLRAEDRKAKAALTRVIRFIEKPAVGLDLPLDIRGTPFQQRVWRAVRKIPLGETSTYTNIAGQISAPRAVRAVGSACTTNHFFMAVPCHRVLHKGESISAGFSKSSEYQRALVEREAKSK